MGLHVILCDITGASYKDDGTTLVHDKDLEDHSTEPAEREGSTSSLPHLSLIKLSDGAQDTVVLLSPIDPDGMLNREGECDRCTNYRVTILSMSKM